MASVRDVSLATESAYKEMCFQEKDDEYEFGCDCHSSPSGTSAR